MSLLLAGHPNSNLTGNSKSHIVNKIDIPDAMEKGISQAAFSGVIKFLVLIELFIIINLIQMPFLYFLRYLIY